jgi:hypothetical protein
MNVYQFKNWLLFNVFVVDGDDDADDGGDGEEELWFINQWNRNEKYNEKKNTKIPQIVEKNDENSLSRWSFSSRTWNVGIYYASL